MKSVRLAGYVFLLLSAAVPAWGAGDPRIENLALCRESWLDWKKNDPSELESFKTLLQSAFSSGSDDGHLTPSSAMTIDDLKVTQVFPGSLGMGLGFSVLVDAPFEAAKQTLERRLGRPLSECEASDGMRTCELSMAEQRTVILASDDTSNSETTLVGCYYFYEK